MHRQSPSSNGILLRTLALLTRQLHDVLQAEEGEMTTLTVDFDVDENFRIQMKDAHTVRKVLFTPVLKERAGPGRRTSGPG